MDVLYFLYFPYFLPLFSSGGRNTGLDVKEVYADKGYRGHEKRTEIEVVMPHLRNKTASKKRKMKRRNAIEAVIGHMKTEYGLSRNKLKGAEGDAFNAAIIAAGYNIKQLLNYLIGHPEKGTAY